MGGHDECTIHQAGALVVSGAGFPAGTQVELYWSRRLPMLNAADHPGAELPVFRLAYFVEE